MVEDNALLEEVSVVGYAGNEFYEFPEHPGSKETRKQHECICRRQVRSRKGEMTYVNT